MADFFAIPLTQSAQPRNCINAACLPTADLVAGARGGNTQAWDALVERFAPLIWSICRRYRLDPADAADVSQCVWMRLVDRLAAVRNPAALAAWLATTTERECAQFLRAARRSRALRQATYVEAIPDEQVGIAEQELLVAERHAVLRAALARLPSNDQQLIGMLIEDPPVPYAEISAKLDIAIGSIGPARRRCLDKLRRDPAIAALINAGRMREAR